MANTATVGFVPLPSSSGNEQKTENPVLVLGPFAPRTIIDFGDVKAGKTAIRCFTIENPNPENVIVTTAKFPSTKTRILLHGYTHEESKHRAHRIPAQSCVDVRVAWTPQFTNGNTMGMREVIELEWDRRKFSIMLVGFAIDTKPKKKVVRKVYRLKPEKPLNLSMGIEENDLNLRFKGVSNHTAKGDKSICPVTKPVTILGENQDSNTKNQDRTKSGKQKLKRENRPTDLELKSPVDCEEKTDELLPTPLRTEFGKESPFAFIDTPVEEQTRPAVAPLKVTPPASSMGDYDSPFQEALTPFTPTPLSGIQQTPADLIPQVAPSPVQSMTKQECLSSSSGEGSTGTPRKRRTWSAPDLNPLFRTPNVMTRGMMKRIGEESSCQQTFMECHTMLPADSVLERASPPRDRECDIALSPGPAPFTPPNETLVEKKSAPVPTALPVPTFNISPEGEGRASGPLTATPLHPSMVLNMERKDDNLPCFDTSIIPHFSPIKTDTCLSGKKSEAFVIPAIETTSSTVDLSQDQAASRPGSEKGSAESKKKPGVLKSALRNQTKPKVRETKAGPVIKSASNRPKTAPGLAKREGLRKNVMQDNPRPSRHPAKRRSLSAPRFESTPNLNTKPPKRKDLVTPTMGPPKSPGKRPRPLQRVVIVDESFREKRHRSCDVAPKTPGTRMSRRSMMAPATGTRVKMNNRLSGALPRHPLALSTAKNTYFDEKWKAKQERGFTVWMNFYLVPPQGTIPPEYQNTRDIMKNAARKIRKSVAPPDNAKTLAKLQAERKLLHSERKASAMFQSPEMIEVQCKLEKEIDDGGLIIRQDRKLDADLGLKDQLIDLLLCYNPVWLRLGLEVLYEEILPLSEHRDFPGLVAFLNSRFVNNPVIATKYAHSTVPGSFGTGYEQELRRFTLKKFLLLVLLLDMAKTRRVIDSDPCLFCLKSPHKTSRSILISFSNTFLSGEGDITKHLGYIGYSVRHEQKHIEEFDYVVKKIETELRDGVRLARLVEIITETSLTDKLRTPCVSRLQKLHNVGLTLTQLQEEGVKLDNVPGGPIVSRSVVDGNQNLTLALIWKIIYQHSISKILAVDRLKAEVKILREILEKKKHVRQCSEEKEDDFVLGLPGRRLSVDERGFFNSEVVNTLMDWCKIVCSYYDVPVDNFTVSFSDGRVLCLLVHHYHPELLPLSRVRMQTSLSHQLMELNASRDFLSDSRLDPELHRENEKENFRALSDAMKGLNEVPYMITSGDMIGTIPDEKIVITFVSYLCAALVDISREDRAAQRIQRAWKVRKFLQRHEEMREQRLAVMRFQALAKAFLARKKLEEMKLNREAIIAERRDYSSRRIQLFWRKYFATKDVRREFLQKRQAAIKIQCFYRKRLEVRWRDKIIAQKAAAIKLQAAFRGLKARVQYQKMKDQKELFERQNKLAVKIQSIFRGFLVRREIQEKKEKAAATKIQAAFRGLKARVDYQKMKDQKQLLENQNISAVKIQSTFRGFLVRQQMLKKSEEAAATKVQAVIRGFLTRKALSRQRTAATKIQTAFRGHKARLEYRRMKHQKRLIENQTRSAVKIQSAFRGFLVRRDFKSEAVAATKIQAAIRGLLVRKALSRQKIAATKVQAAVRGFLIRKELRRQQIAATKVQAVIRGFLVRKALSRQQTAATKIQTAFRGHNARVEYQKMKDQKELLENQNRSAVKIQSAFRGFLVRQQIKSEVTAATRIQAAIKGFLVRIQLSRWQTAATKVQSAYRGHKTRTLLKLQQRSAIKIQQAYRGYRQMKSERSYFKKKKCAAVKIQAYWRMVQVQRQIAKQDTSAVLIQSVWRMYQARSVYRKQRNAACLIQLQVRAWIEGFRQRRKYLKLRNAAIFVQACYRGTQTRRLIHKQTISATKIQAAWRMYSARVQHLAQKCAANKIISTWRMYSQRSRYLDMKRKVVLIQAWFRMQKQMLEYQNQRKSCIRIQAKWRGYSARRRYQTTRDAVIRIQAAARGHNARLVISLLRTLRDLRCKVIDGDFSQAQVREIKAIISDKLGS